MITRISLIAAAWVIALLASVNLQPAGAQSVVADNADPLAIWRQGVKVHAVAPQPARHTIHSYYVCNPESPDGTRVVFYASATANGHSGDVCVLDRASGKETVLARGVNTEDAHRAACQQWISGGKAVAFHDVQNGHWSVELVDVATQQRRTLIRDHQLAFGQGSGDLLPVYGCHWNPGSFRDLELLDVATGETRVALTADAVQRQYGKWLAKEFGDKQISIFFPVLSPDLKRVFFKIAAGSGGSVYQSKGASHRQGLIGYDLEADRFLFQRDKWGHPAWGPDSRTIIEVGNILIDSSDGAVTRIPDQPNLRGCHPSLSPDGKLFVTDGMLDSLGGKPGEWGIVVGDLRGKRYELLHRFDNTHGAKSWRTNHPHPVFSADGRRIYFNVNSGDWTELHVAEAGG